MVCKLNLEYIGPHWQKYIYIATVKNNSLGSRFFRGGGGGGHGESQGQDPPIQYPRNFFKIRNLRKTDICKWMLQHIQSIRKLLKVNLFTPIS